MVLYNYCDLPCRDELSFFAVSLNLFYLSGEITALEIVTTVCKLGFV